MPSGLADAALELELDRDEPPRAAAPLRVHDPYGADHDVVDDWEAPTGPPVSRRSPLGRLMLALTAAGALAVVVVLAGVGSLAVIGLMLEDTPTAQSAGGDGTADASERTGNGGKKRRKGGAGGSR